MVAPRFIVWALKGFFYVLSGVDNSREEVAFFKPLNGKKRIWSVLKENEWTHIFTKLKDIFQLQQLPPMVQDESVHSKRDLLRDAPDVTWLSFQRGYRTWGSCVLTLRLPCSPSRGGHTPAEGRVDGAVPLQRIKQLPWGGKYYPTFWKGY